MAFSTFHDYLLNNLSAVQMETLVGKGKIKSHKRLNFIFKKPYAATLDEVLFFSELLNKAPYTLLKDFSLGRNTLGARVVLFLLKTQQQHSEPVMAT